MICKKMALFKNEQDDCMNETFLAIWQNIKKYDEKEEFRELLQGLSSEAQDIFMELFWEQSSHDKICTHSNIKKENIL